MREDMGQRLLIAKDLGMDYNILSFVNMHASTKRVVL